jgi:probable phosphoglycerate mutase
MSLYVIRHGETRSNAERVLQFPETPLSERGLAQADRMAARLREAGIQRILSSDYARARMTADALQSATGVELVEESLLRERNYGDLRGERYDDLGFNPHAEGYAPPGGESWESFHARVDRAWERLRLEIESTDAPIAIVTHGLVCMSLATRHFARGEDDVPMGFGNTSVTVVDAAPPWRIQLLNCCRHLDGATAEAADAISGL